MKEYRLLFAYQDQRRLIILQPGLTRCAQFSNVETVSMLIPGKLQHDKRGLAAKETNFSAFKSRGRSGSTRLLINQLHKLHELHKVIDQDSMRSRPRGGLCVWRCATQVIKSQSIEFKRGCCIVLMCRVLTNNLLFMR